MNEIEIASPYQAKNFYSLVEFEFEKNNPRNVLRLRDNVALNSQS